MRDPAFQPLPTSAAPAAAGGAQGTVVAAFIGMTLIGGMNFIGVKFTVAELDPFWGATMRFTLAAFLLAWFAVLTRVPWPRGGGLVNALLFGVLGIGASYALAYYALVGITAGLLSVFVATVPLLTLLFAALHGLERLTLRNLLGSLLVIAGISVLLGDQIAGDVSWPHLVAGFLMPVAIAESSVLVKKLPKVHPMTLNAVGMAVGSGLTFAIALVLSEDFVAPTQPRTLAAVAYLVVIGSVGLFTLFMYVLQRWSASATSYQAVLMPIVAVAFASLLAGETFRTTFFVGALIVLLGVYVAALRPRRARPALTVAGAPQSAASTTGAPRP